MNAIENERYDPSLPLAFAIARVFALRIEDVFTPDAEPPPAPSEPPE
jgi:putative transcriptional regulator